MLFGNYYAYDNPSALNRQLKEWLGSSAEVFQWQLNLLYSVYSLPNIILPLILGALLDRFGQRQMVYLLSLFIVLGQLIFTIGVGKRDFPIMIIGRILFGIGGESLSVAQTKLMTDWFRGKELSLAIGLNLSVGRVGTVANNILSPLFANLVDVPFALWMGTISCVISLFCSIWTTQIDGKYRTKFINVPIELVGRKNSDETLAEESPVSIAPPQSINGYHPCFWILTAICFLLYGVLVPFNNIVSDFLQTKYAQLDPITAGRLMSIPDSLCIFIVPVLGIFLDRVGYRATLFTIGSAIVSLGHYLFAATDIPAVYILLLLGLSNSTLLALWPCVPLLVDKSRLSTAYGIITSAINTSFMLFPVFVATLINSDTTYTTCELFFSSLAAMAFLLSVLLNYFSVKWELGLNDAEFRVKEYAKLSPIIPPQNIIETRRMSEHPKLYAEQVKFEDPTMLLVDTDMSHQKLFRRSKHGFAQ